MARPTDPQKIENLKKAAMDMIVKYGYRGASIAAIAKEAGVSAGYLYRYYKSKDELIDDLIDTEFEKGFESMLETAEKYTCFYDLLYDLFLKIFEIMKEDKIKARFALSLALEYDFAKAKRKKAFAESTFDKYALNLDYRTGEINPEYNEDDILLVIPIIPLQYIAAIIEHPDYRGKLNAKAAAKMARMCINALR